MLRSLSPSLFFFFLISSFKLIKLLTFLLFNKYYSLCFNFFFSYFVKKDGSSLALVFFRKKKEINKILVEIFI